MLKKIQEWACANNANKKETNFQQIQNTRKQQPKLILLSRKQNQL